MSKPRITLPVSATDSKKRIAAYCRVSSSSDEQSNSLAAQVSYYENYFSENNDIEFAGAYADKGISGTRTRNRTEFLRLIEDCRAGKVDGIVTKSVSRFGRNTVDTLVFTRELRSLGIDVFFEKENLHSCSPEGELLLTLMAAMAEAEAVSMSDNIKWGKRKRFEKGIIESLSLQNMYGFRKTNSGIEILDTEAAVVRHMYALFLDGFGYAEIAKQLNKENIPTRRNGLKWEGTTVKNIITNEKNCGNCLFQKTYIQDPISHKSRPNRGELPQFLVEDCLPAIIDKEIWLVAQKMQDRHRRNGRAIASEQYPFTGLLYCGICGAPLHYYHYKSEGFVMNAVYRCSSRKNQAGQQITGMTYTRPHKSTYTKKPSPGLIDYRERYCSQYNKPRQMLCTDIRIPINRPQKAFVQAWNYIVSQQSRYQATLKRTAQMTEDVVVRYRANELLKLIGTVGRIRSFDYALMRKTVDRVETTVDGKLTILFQSGIRITV